MQPTIFFGEVLFQISSLGWFSLLRSSLECLKILLGNPSSSMDSSQQDSLGHSQPPGALQFRFGPCWPRFKS